MKPEACPSEAEFTGPHFDYFAVYMDARKRHQRGQEQRECQRCGRWRWPDQQNACERFVPGKTQADHDAEPSGNEVTK